MKALIVLGYHEYRADGSHGISEVCRACVRRAEELARACAPGTVVFTGWGSTGGRSEAEQMRELWSIAGPELLLEPQARNTAENAVRSLRLLEGRGVDRATVVCSIRHRIRVPYFFGELYRRNGIAVDYEYVTSPLPVVGRWVEEAIGIALMRKHRRAAERLLGGG